MRLSTSILACLFTESDLLARSQTVLNRVIERLFFVRSLLCFFLKSFTIQSIILLLKSSPPKCVSPAVALT